MCLLRIYPVAVRSSARRSTAPGTTSPLAASSVVQPLRDPSQLVEGSSQRHLLRGATTTATGRAHRAGRGAARLLLVVLRVVAMMVTVVVAATGGRRVDAAPAAPWRLVGARVVDRRVGRWIGSSAAGMRLR